MKIRYFDNAATTAVREEVIKEMLPYFSLNYGNASALYSVGREARRGLDKSRLQVAKAINCIPHEIFFTSCGSESDNLALKGVAYANRNKGNHIITSKIEHHAVLNSCNTLEKQGFKDLAAKEYKEANAHQRRIKSREELEKMLNIKPPEPDPLDPDSGL